MQFTWCFLVLYQQHCITLPLAVIQNVSFTLHMLVPTLICALTGWYLDSVLWRCECGLCAVVKESSRPGESDTHVLQPGCKQWLSSFVIASVSMSGLYPVQWCIDCWKQVAIVMVCFVMWTEDSETERERGGDSGGNWEQNGEWGKREQFQDFFYVFPWDWIWRCTGFDMIGKLIKM